MTNNKKTLETKKSAEIKKIENGANGEKEVIKIVTPEKEVNKIPFTAVLNEKLLDLQDEQKALTAELEREKKAKNDVTVLSGDIKAVKRRIKEVTTLLHLYIIREANDTTEFFKEYNDDNNIGQYYNFNFKYALDILTLPKNNDYAADIAKMTATLETIQGLIKLINGAKIYENIYNDILPRYTNDQSLVDFAECKKLIENFIKDNNAKFANGINVLINNADAKTFITSLLKVTKSHEKNNINLVQFPVFLNEFQRMVCTKVANIAVKIAQMKKDSKKKD